MSAGSNFFICACAILVFSIINYKIGPIINGVVGPTWALENCAKMSDDFKDDKKSDPDMSEEVKERRESKIRKCRNEQAMYNMEHKFHSF